MSGRRRRLWWSGVSALVVGAFVLVLGCSGAAKSVSSADWAARPQRAESGAGYQRAIRRVAQRSKLSTASRRGKRAFFSSAPVSGSHASPQGGQLAPPATAHAERAPRRHRRRPRRHRRARREAKKRQQPPTLQSRPGEAGVQANRRAYKVEVLEETPTAQVVYLGYLKLQVRRRIAAVDAITSLVQKSGGYIEQLGRTTMTLRVPAKDFEASMAAFSELGRVLARRVQALDVTAQFTDLDARLAVAKASRARLLALLATLKDVQERLRVVREIKRLSDRIEDLESSVNTLRNLVAYYTITIDLVALDRRAAATRHRSPFRWIQRLVAHRVSLKDGQRSVGLTPARGFVRLKKAESWLARAADTSSLRAAVLDNDPEGDTAFWAAAVQHELAGRGERLLETATLGQVRYSAWRNRDVKPRVWLVAVRAVGDQLAVVEAFFPSEASWRRHKAAVLAAIRTLEVK